MGNMSIRIDTDKCRGCGKCMDVCPGNLIQKNESGKAYIRHPDECWGCTACLKECAFWAAVFYLGPDIGGRGGRMYVETLGNLLRWKFVSASGEEKIITVNKNEANHY